MNSWTTTRTSTTVAALAVVVAALAGCSSSGGGTGTGATSATGAASGAADSSATASPSRPAALTAEQLKPGLITLQDMPAGFQVDSSADSSGGGNNGVSATSPGCADLVAIMKANRPAGTQAYVTANFNHGQAAAMIEEELDGLPSAAEAKAFVTAMAAAIRSCPAVQMAVPGVGAQDLRVTAVEVPPLGDASAAALLTITSGQQAGFQMTVVGVATGRIIVGLTMIGVAPADVRGGTGVAVQKVLETLGPLTRS